jgi:hypothetical protein
MRSEAELFAVADRALAFADGDEAQATACWERTPAGAEALTVEVVVLRDGRAGFCRTDSDREDAIREAVRAAGEAAATGLERPPLPDPAPGRPHDGWDPAIALGQPLPDEVTHAAAARTAIVSTRGVRAFEQRSFAATGSVVATHAARLLAAASTPFALPGPEAGGPGEPRLEAGEVTVVLSPEAVAHVLWRLADRFSAAGERLPAGRRVAASCISLAESPRFPGTLPRTYDAEGVPRQPLPLIQDGVAHRVVGDTRTGASTGHARSVAGSDIPVPEHFVLVGGGAQDVAELAQPVAAGLYVEAFEAGIARARLIADGVIGGGSSDVAVELDPLAVLASAQALTGAQRTIGLRLDSARDAASAVCPALRAGGGVHVLAR